MGKGGADRLKLLARRLEHACCACTIAAYKWSAASTQSELYKGKKRWADCRFRISRHETKPADNLICGVLRPLLSLDLAKLSLRLQLWCVCTNEAWGWWSRRAAKSSLPFFWGKKKALCGPIWVWKSNHNLISIAARVLNLRLPCWEKYSCTRNISILMGLVPDRWGKSGCLSRYF